MWVALWLMILFAWEVVLDPLAAGPGSCPRATEADPNPLAETVDASFIHRSEFPGKSFAEVVVSL